MSPGSPAFPTVPAVEVRTGLFCLNKFTVTVTAVRTVARTVTVGATVSFVPVALGGGLKLNLLSEKSPPRLNVLSSF